MACREGSMNGGIWRRDLVLASRFDDAASPSALLMRRRPHSSSERRATALHPAQLYARQLTGTAMLRPAASPWRSFAHRAGAATARRRCINISATNASTEPALDQQVNIDAAATPAVSPGIVTCYCQLNDITHSLQMRISRSLALPSRSSPSPSLPRKPSSPAAVPWSV